MNISKQLGFAIVLVSISSVLQWCSYDIGNTFLWWILYTWILWLFYKCSCDNKIYVLRYFISMVVLSAIYGIKMAENYWDWKLLIGNLMVFLLPLACYTFDNSIILSTVLRYYVRWAPFILILLAPGLDSDAFGRFLVPFTFMALFITDLSKKNKVMVILAMIVTFFAGNDSRSDVLKFSICLLMGLCTFYPWMRKIFDIFVKPLHVAFLISPFVLFALGVTNTFNVFMVDEELGLDGKYTMTDGSTGDEISMLTDTRTFLYVEEIESAVNNNYWLIGRSLARGYDSSAFGSAVDGMKGLNRGERDSCEVSILNIFNYFGVIGVLLYFYIFIISSKLAIYESKNFFVRVIGLYVSFRWMFAWIEDFSRFDLNYLFLWIMIGICLSTRWRNMSDEEFTQWIKSL